MNILQQIPFQQKVKGKTTKEKLGKNQTEEKSSSDSIENQFPVWCGTAQTHFDPRLILNQHNLSIYKTMELQNNLRKLKKKDIQQVEQQILKNLQEQENEETQQEQNQNLEQNNLLQNDNNPIISLTDTPIKDITNQQQLTRPNYETDTIYTFTQGQQPIQSTTSINQQYQNIFDPKLPKYLFEMSEFEISQPINKQQDQLNNKYLYNQNSSQKSQNLQINSNTKENLLISPNKNLFCDSPELLHKGVPFYNQKTYHKNKSKQKFISHNSLNNRNNDFDSTNIQLYIQKKQFNTTPNPQQINKPFQSTEEDFKNNDKHEQQSSEKKLIQFQQRLQIIQNENNTPSASSISNKNNHYIQNI